MVISAFVFLDLRSAKIKYRAGNMQQQIHTKLCGLLAHLPVDITA